MSRPLLIADLFCGAGGSSTGAMRAVKALKRKAILVCVNHWPVAIETHQKNHPEARHYCEDVTVVDPVKIVPDGYLDLLMASPECRFYSRARAGKPVHDQGRMNPWAVNRWLTSLNVRTVLIENVPEFIYWGPLLPDGRPDPKKRGQYFQAWLRSFWELGYKTEWRYLNAADYGDATTRVRFFLIARKDRKPIRWPEATHSETGEADMLGQCAKWRSAREIINWRNTGRSILDDPKYQKHPLSTKTLKRIARGFAKFGGPLAPHYINLLGFNVPEQTGGDGIAFIMGKNGNSPAYRSCDQPLPTITTDGHPLLIQPTAKPFVLGQQSKSSPRKVDKPIPTIATHGAIGLINPMMIKYFGTEKEITSIDKPLPTITIKQTIGLALPTISPFIIQNHIRPDSDRVYSTDKPLDALTTKRGDAIVNPIIIQTDQTVAHGSCSWPIDSPLVEEIAVLAKERNIDTRRLVVIDGILYVLDIRFRMLENSELARAMSFTNNEYTYEFVGNNEQVTKQIGNAIPVGLAEACVTAILGG